MHYRTMAQMQQNNKMIMTVEYVHHASAIKQLAFRPKYSKLCVLMRCVQFACFVIKQMKFYLRPGRPIWPGPAFAH